MELDDLPKRFSLVISAEPQKLTEVLEASLEGGSGYVYHAPITGRRGGFFFTKNYFHTHQEQLPIEVQNCTDIVQRLMEKLPDATTHPREQPGKVRGWELWIFASEDNDGNPACAAFATWLTPESPRT